MAFKESNLSFAVFTLMFTAALGTFSCKRPTTPCSQLYECNTQSGQCACSSGSIGLQCNVPVVNVNVGTCLVINPCSNGATCYTSASGPLCSCPDGFYGGGCQHPMIYTKCYQDKMEVNIFPYGYDSLTWKYDNPSTGVDNMCKLQTISMVRTMGLNYILPAWDGFAGQFSHVNDLCAGNATVVWDNSTGTLYSRRIHIGYSSIYYHETDQDILVQCEVLKQKQATTAIRTNAIKYYVTDASGWPVDPFIKLGSKVNVTFHLDRATGFDDLKLLDCVVVDTEQTTRTIVVSNSCPVPPIGVSLSKVAADTQTLTLAMHKFPGRANDLHFQCRIRLCLATDNTCSLHSGCLTRAKRSARLTNTDLSPSENIVIIGSRLTK